MSIFGREIREHEGISNLKVTSQMARVYPHASNAKCFLTINGKCNRCSAKYSIQIAQNPSGTKSSLVDVAVKRTGQHEHDKMKPIQKRTKQLRDEIAQDVSFLSISF